VIKAAFNIPKPNTITGARRRQRRSSGAAQFNASYFFARVNAKPRTSEVLLEFSCARMVAAPRELSRSANPRDFNGKIRPRKDSDAVFRIHFV
jgi:hypothetical protein